MKDILFVPLVFLLIAGAGFVYEVYFDKPNLNDFGHFTAQDPLGLYDDPKPADFQGFSAQQKFQLIPRLIDELDSKNEPERHWVYVGLCTMTGVPIGTWEQMKDWPQGPKAIQTEYRKWWNGILRQRTAQDPASRKK